MVLARRTGERAVGVGRFVSMLRGRESDEAAVADVHGKAEIVRLDGVPAERMAEEANVRDDTRGRGHLDRGSPAVVLSMIVDRDRTYPGVVPDRRRDRGGRRLRVRGELIAVRVHDPDDGALRA